VKILAIPVLLFAACDAAPDTMAPPEATADAGPSTDDCPTSVFLDVAASPGSGGQFARPSLSVSCTADTMTVRGNGIPTYTFVPTTPNALAAQNNVYNLPRHPTVQASPTDLPLLGFVAVAVNGVPAFGPNEAGMPANTQFGDPVYNGITDYCLGHTAPGGAYHYHAFLEACLRADNFVAEPWGTTLPGDQPSPVLGFAADGFAIYGSFECVDAGCAAVREMLSSWERTGDPTTFAWQAHTFVAKVAPEYLDRCNGHVGPHGDYHYHATADFPYVLGCFSGRKGN
jgi:hypothetical protein